MFGWLSLKLNWICSWSLDMMLWYLSFFKRCLCTKTLCWLSDCWPVRQQGSCLWFQTQLPLSVNDGEIQSEKGLFNRKCIHKWNPDGANKRKVFVFYINYHRNSKHEMVCNTNARNTPPKNEFCHHLHHLHSRGSKPALHFFLLQSTKENILRMLGTK